MRTSIALIALFTGIASSATAQVTIADSDFQDGTTQGWDQGFDNGVSVIADAGPDGPGDFSLQAVPNPGRLRIFPFNTEDTDYLGDLLSAQVARVEFDAQITASSTDSMSLHAVVLAGDFDRWASLASAEVPNDGQWRHYSIPLTVADMINVLGGNDYATDFSAVTRFGFRHQDEANQAGGSELSSADNFLLIDNVELIGVPAPATVILPLLGAAMVHRRR